MKIPDHVKFILRRWHTVFPVPQRAPSRQSPEDHEESVRQWNLARIAQVVFETGNKEGWGAKRADPGRPISKDAIAQRTAGGVGLRCWDTLLGTGTGHPTPFEDPDSIDIDDQIFVPVPPRDGLSGRLTPGPSPEPAPDRPPTTIPPYWGDQRSVDIMTVVFADYAEAGQAPNAGMGTWLGRVMYDTLVAGGSVDKTLAAHRNVWRSILGLPLQ